MPDQEGWAGRAPGLGPSPGGRQVHEAAAIGQRVGDQVGQPFLQPTAVALVLPQRPAPALRVSHHQGQVAQPGQRLAKVGVPLLGAAGPRGNERHATAGPAVRFVDGCGQGLPVFAGQAYGVLCTGRSWSRGQQQGRLESPEDSVALHDPITPPSVRRTTTVAERGRPPGW